MKDPFYCELLRSDVRNRMLIQNFTIHREAEFSQLPDKIVGLEAYLKRCTWDDDENDIYTPLEPEYDGGCRFMYQRFYSS